MDTIIKPCFSDQGVGGSHSLLIYSDGSVWSHGLNNFGQLGDGTRINHSLPQKYRGFRMLLPLALAQLSHLLFKQTARFGDGEIIVLVNLATERL